MARPDTDDGWLRYAHELDAAIALADFTRAARVVLHEALAQIYGPAKLRSAELHPNGIAARCGILRPMVSRGLAELVADGVLVREPDGRFRFAKNYEAWTKGGKPRFTPTQVAYAKSAPSRAMAYKFGGGGTDRTDNNTSGINPVTPEVAIQLPSPEPEVTQSLPRGSNPVTEPVTQSLPRSAAAYRNAGAEFKTETKETEEKSSTPPPVEPKQEPAPRRKAEVIPAVSGEYGDPKHEPPYQPDDDMLYPVGGTHDLTDAEARAIWTKVWRLTGQSRACTEFVQKRNHHSAAVWLKAIEELRQRGTAVRGLYIIDLRANDIEVRPPAATAAPYARRPTPRPSLACDEVLTAASRRKAMLAGSADEPNR